MKQMKLRRLILLWSLLAVSLPVQLIKGDTPANPNPPVKSKSISACSVMQSFDNVALYFNLDLSVVTVSVEDETGNLIFYTEVTATSGSSLLVETASWGTGYYTLKVANNSGVIYTTMIDVP